jgi:hypothetical protein
LGDSPVLKIVDYLIENRLLDYSKKDIIEGTEIGRATFFKYWKNLEKFGIVKMTRKFGKTKLYKLNEENKIVKLLIAVDWALTEKSLEETKIKVPIKTAEF